MMLALFGISPIGWVHTLGSLPAVPVALYMLARYGRIVPRSTAGAIYFVSMMIGTLTIVFVAKMPASYVIGIVTLLLLLVGYGVGRGPNQSSAKRYIETISLTLTVFLLMVPSVTETLRRIPDGHPIVTDLHSPILLGAQGALGVLLVIGLTAQIIYMRKQAYASQQHAHSDDQAAKVQYK